MCMTESTTNRWVTFACAAAFIAGTLTTLREVSAQEETRKAQVVEKELKGDFDQRLDAGEAPAGGMTVVMNESSDGTEYSVRIENGKTTVQKDGKKLSKDQYRIRDGKVEFLDKDGDVEHSMKLPTTGGAGAGNFLWGSPRAVAPRAARPAEVAVEGSKPPPVMLGITMSDDDGGALIDSVRDDLPAQKAGLKAGDIILKIDGKTMGGQADVRTALKKHKADDKVSILVNRDGDEKTFEVTLEAWDAEKLAPEDGAVTVPGVPAVPGDPFNGNMNNWWRNFSMDLGESHTQALQEAREALEAALEKVDDAKDNLEDLRKAAKDGLEAAIKSLKEAEEQAGQQRGMRLVVPNQEGGNAQTLVLPRVLEDRQRMRSQEDEVRKQLDELREQMKEIRKQLQEKKKDDR